MRSRLAAWLAHALLAGALAAGCTAPSERLRFASGPQGGAWYPLAGALKSVVEARMPGLSVQVLPGGGIANVLAVETDRAQMAFANSVSTLDAINGQPPFQNKATHVCNVATLYPQYFQVVTLADSGIASPADFRGRVLAAQQRGNTAEAITAHLLQAYGMSYRDLAGVNYGSYTDSVALMKDGNADIFTLGTSIPASAIMDLASGRDVRLVDIPDDGLARMRALNPGYERTVIPAGTYPKQDRDVLTIGYATHLIARCDLDAKIVYTVLDGLYTRRDDLAAIARALKRATVRSMGRDIGVPLHAGAAQWYREKSSGS
ncbi:MAG TPA: TAXI family TRAP transporter solute-binding subunit [Burkholderiales bacterium]|jgi:TRAP transporter TAXI family solute receptor|nr:TAXI family TRAP transporter solute-binding subunit [Burkholderiales bacterium]